MSDQQLATSSPGGSPLKRAASAGKKYIRLRGKLRAEDFLYIAQDEDFRTKFKGITLDLSEAQLPTNAEGKVGLPDNAFAECGCFEEIILPTNTMVLGARALYQCRNLKRLVLPDSITTIHSHALEGLSSLPYLKLPKALAWVGYECFGGQGASNCAIELPWTEPPMLQCIYPARTQGLEARFNVLQQIIWYSYENSSTSMDEDDYVFLDTKATAVDVLYYIILLRDCGSRYHVVIDTVETKLEYRTDFREGISPGLHQVYPDEHFSAHCALLDIFKSKKQVFLIPQDTTTGYSKNAWEYTDFIFYPSWMKPLFVFANKTLSLWKA